MRERWRSYGGDLCAELVRHDLAEAWRLHPSDRQRKTRALEVIDQTGISLKDWQTRGAAAAPLRGFAVHKLFKNAPRNTLYAKANARFGQMLEQGALDEVRALPPLDPKAPMMKAIGGRELLACLRGELTFDEARTKAQTVTSSSANPPGGADRCRTGRKLMNSETMRGITPACLRWLRAR